MASILEAALLPLALSTSRRNLLILKKARLRPEKIADCDTQNSIPSQIKISCMCVILLNVFYSWQRLAVCVGFYSIATGHGKGKLFSEEVLSKSLSPRALFSAQEFLKKDIIGDLGEHVLKIYFFYIRRSASKLVTHTGI